jgi:hypothetical protein
MKHSGPKHFGPECYANLSAQHTAKWKERKNNPGRWRQEDCGFKASLGKGIKTPSQKQNTNKKGLGHGSSGKA